MVKSILSKLIFSIWIVGFLLIIISKANLVFAASYTYSPGGTCSITVSHTASPTIDVVSGSPTWTTRVTTNSNCSNEPFTLTLINNGNLTEVNRDGWSATDYDVTATLGANDSRTWTWQGQISGTTCPTGKQSVSTTVTDGIHSAEAIVQVYGAIGFTVTNNTSSTISVETRVLNSGGSVVNTSSPFDVLPGQANGPTFTQVNCSQGPFTAQYNVNGQGWRSDITKIVASNGAVSGNGFNITNGCSTQAWIDYNGPAATPIPPTPTPTATPAVCPAQTCTYTQADSDCASGVAQCKGNGCTGFNCSVCNYQACLNTGSRPGGCECVPVTLVCEAPVLQGSCDATSTTLNFSWSAPPNNCAKAYAVRVDDKANGWGADSPLPGDTVNNSVSGTSFSRPTSTGPTYEAWVHAINSAGVYSADSNHVTVNCAVAPTITLTPTASPTPTPVVGELNVTLWFQCVAGDPTREKAMVEWLTISGGESYRPELKNASGAVVGGGPSENDPPIVPAVGTGVGTRMNFWFPNSVPAAPPSITYTGWVHAQNANGNTFRSDSDQRNAINCSIPATPTPTGGGGGGSSTECEPRPPYFCTSSNSSPQGCTPQQQEAKHAYCRGVTGFGGSICFYCPPPTIPPPPPTECLNEQGLLQVTPEIVDNCLAYGSNPACRDASGSVRNIRIKLSDPGVSGGGGGDDDNDQGLNIHREKNLVQRIHDAIIKIILAAQSSRGYYGNFYRTDTLGFIDAGTQKTFIGENPHGERIFYDNAFSKRVTYFQAQNYNAAGQAKGPTGGIWVAPEEKDPRRCQRGGRFDPSYSISNVSTFFSSSNSVILKWTLNTNFAAADGHPAYYIISKNGVNGFVNPGSVVSPGAIKDNQFCDSFCSWHRDVYYQVLNLTPNKLYQFGVGYAWDLSCRPVFGYPAAFTLTGTQNGTSPTTKPLPPSSVGASVDTRAKVTKLSFASLPGGTEEGTKIYSSQTRWPEDEQIETEYHNSTLTDGPMGTGAYFWAQESLDNLDPGVYYYGLRGYGANCSGIQTAQAAYEVKGFKISGKVFFDENANSLYDPSPGPDKCYTGTVRFSVDDTGRGTSKAYDVNVNNCDYSFALKYGTYKVSFAPPFGFRLTTTSATPFTTTLPPDSTNRNFGIYAPPWFQTMEGDVRSAKKLVNQMPDKTPKLKMSLDGVKSPGIVFYGGAANDVDLGFGLASSKGWLVNESFISSTDLSYESFESRALAAGGSVSPYRCGIQGCISAPAQNGVFRYVVEEGRETMVVAQPWTISGGKRVIILVPGDLRIQGSLTARDAAVTNKQIIKVDKGSFLAFIVKGNIIIDPAIGWGGNPSKLQKTDSNLDGFFIADGSFIPGTFDTAGTDNRLNIEGMAMVGTKTVSELRLNRHLGSANNTNYPSVYVKYRLDMVMNAHPAFLRPFFHWEEIAP